MKAPKQGTIELVVFVGYIVGVILGLDIGVFVVYTFVVILGLSLFN